MSISKEELLHIAKLSDLKIKDDEIDKYLKNLEDILNYTEIINNAPCEDLEETIGANDSVNAFRKDEVNDFKDTKDILNNAPDMEKDMFKIPKVIQ